MTRSRSALLAVVAIALALAGCAANEHQDIKEWMKEQSKGMKGKVAPLPEIKPFPVVSYEAESMTPPFSPGKVVTLEPILDKTAPDQDRPRQPLESFPLEDLRVVGVILSGAVPYALIQTPQNKPKHVRVGDYMGRNFGKIMSITKEGVTVKETLKDANGAWADQEKVLAVPKEGGRL